MIMHKKEIGTNSETPTGELGEKKRAPKEQNFTDVDGFTVIKKKWWCWVILLSLIILNILESSNNT